MIENKEQVDGADKPASSQEVYDSAFLVPAADRGKAGLKDLGWYVKILKRPVIALAALELLVWGLRFLGRNQATQDWAEVLFLLIKLVVFAYVAIRVKRKYGETLGQVLVTAFLAGLSLGLAAAIFKLLWLWQFWTVFNLIIEPVFTGFVAGLVGLIAAVFVRRKRLD